MTRLMSETVLGEGNTNVITTLKGSSTPVSILFLLVDYNENIHPYPDSPEFIAWIYDNTSGTYPLGTDGISGFISLVQSGKLDVRTRTAAIPADGIPVIQNPCYVVFAISPSAGGEFITRDPGAVSTNCVTQYDADGNPIDPDYSGFVQVTDATGIHIAYFLAKSPSQNGALGYRDGFNLNLSVGTIDPDIQNTGHGRRHHRKGAATGVETRISFTAVVKTSC